MKLLAATNSTHDDDDVLSVSDLAGLFFFSLLSSGVMARNELAGRGGHAKFLGVEKWSENLSLVGKVSSEMQTLRLKQFLKTFYEIIGEKVF